MAGTPSLLPGNVATTYDLVVNMLGKRLSNDDLLGPTGRPLAEGPMPQVSSAAAGYVPNARQAKAAPASAVLGVKPRKPRVYGQRKQQRWNNDRQLLGNLQQLKADDDGSHSEVTEDERCATAGSRSTFNILQAQPRVSLGQRIKQALSASETSDYHPQSDFFTRSSVLRGTNVAQIGGQVLYEMDQEQAQKRARKPVQSNSFRDISTAMNPKTSWSLLKEDEKLCKIYLKCREMTSQDAVKVDEWKIPFDLKDDSLPPAQKLDLLLGILREVAGEALPCSVSPETDDAGHDRTKAATEIHRRMRRSERGLSGNDRRCLNDVRSRRIQILLDGFHTEQRHRPFVQVPDYNDAVAAFRELDQDTQEDILNHVLTTILAERRLHQFETDCRYTFGRLHEFFTDGNGFAVSMCRSLEDIYSAYSQSVLSEDRALVDGKEDVPVRVFRLSDQLHEVIDEDLGPPPTPIKSVPQYRDKLKAAVLELAKQHRGEVMVEGMDMLRRRIAHGLAALYCLHSEAMFVKPKLRVFRSAAKILFIRPFSTASSRRKPFIPPFSITRWVLETSQNRDHCYALDDSLEMKADCG